MNPPFKTHVLAPTVERVAAQLQPFCKRLEIAGSYRRQREYCNDLDFVIIPSNLSGLRDRIRNSTAQMIRDGDQNITFRLKTSIQVDLFLAHDGTADLLTKTPSNWGSILLCRTGSREHNIYMVERAKALGLRWDTYKGIFEGNTLIASETEQDIFSALKMDYLEPQDRK